MRAAIDVLAALGTRKLFVIGDMGELGADAPAMHAQIGEYARAQGVTTLYALGELSAQTVQAFGAGARHFDSIEELIAQIRSELSSDMTMLVKGSRFMRMERVVQACVTDVAEETH
jgi:UDP-N-acetylmuramyl pentapeptide synthase